MWLSSILKPFVIILRRDSFFAFTTKSKYFRLSIVSFIVYLRICFYFNVLNLFILKVMFNTLFNLLYWLSFISYKHNPSKTKIVKLNYI